MKASHSIAAAGTTAKDFSGVLGNWSSFITCGGDMTTWASATVTLPTGWAGSWLSTDSIFGVH
jgi:hypothetical protein